MRVGGADDALSLGRRLFRGSGEARRRDLLKGMRVVPWHGVDWWRIGAAAGGRRLPIQLEWEQRRRSFRTSPQIDAAGRSRSIEPSAGCGYFGFRTEREQVSGGKDRAR